MTALEDRLSRLDLQLASVGEHLSDERLASIAQGVEPADFEAGHLAGCDACTELLMAVGVGLEAALADLPGAEDWVHPPTQPISGGASWGTLLGGGALLVSAAALWVALGTGDAPPSKAIDPPTRVIQSAEPTQPSSIPAATSPGRSASNAASRIAPARAPASEPAPAPGAATTEARPGERAREPEPTPKAAPQQTGMPRGEMRVRGPRPLNQRPVDAPPRGSGYLRLAAKPPAKVYIDGTFIGWTPLVDHRLIEGPHDVRLVYQSDRARVAEERFRVVIEPDRIWRSLRRNLRR